MASNNFISVLTPNNRYDPLSVSTATCAVSLQVQLVDNHLALMPLLQPTHFRLAKVSQTARKIVQTNSRSYIASPAEFLVIDRCPPSTCTCQPTPQGLEIDRVSKLNGTIAPYSQHVLVSTGQRDWKSRIEDEHATGQWGPFLARLKKEFGRKGRFHDPSRNVLISASSFHPSNTAERQACEVLVFPSSHRERFLLDEQSNVNGEQLRSLCETLSGAEKFDSTSTRGNDTTTSDGSHNPDYLSYPTILICGHGGRDNRCGVLGPLLEKQFHQSISERSSKTLPISSSGGSGELHLDQTNIGLISHIGGHKWAGNCIINIPPSWHVHLGGESHPSPLAGCGIWYGRVEPRHVDGIVTETLLKGRLIQELFRGGIDQESRPIRLPD